MIIIIIFIIYFLLVYIYLLIFKLPGLNFNFSHNKSMNVQTRCVNTFTTVTPSEPKYYTSITSVPRYVIFGHISDVLTHCLGKLRFSIRLRNQKPSDLGPDVNILLYQKKAKSKNLSPLFFYRILDSTWLGWN